MNFWIVKCSKAANDNDGWSWDSYFGEDDAYPTDDDWGGPDWIKSGASRQHIKQVRKGDLVVCYQFEGRRICGLTYMSGDGRDEPRNSGDFCMLHIAAGRKAIAVDPGLTVTELRQTGCNPKYLGPGSQGTIFPLTDEEFEGVVLAIGQWRPEMWPKLDNWLEREGYGRVPGQLLNLRKKFARGGGFAVDPVQRAKVERAAIDFVWKRMESKGWQVESVERLCCGYDLICQKGRKRRDIEVKGVSASIRSFPITGGEVRQAETDADFHISIVTNALSKSPDCEELTGREFLKAYGLTPIQFMARPK